MKKTLLWILGFVVIAACLIYFLTSRGKTPEPPRVKKVPVSAPLIEQPLPPAEKALQWRGTVQPEKIADVIFKVGGTLENGEANFQKGSRFRKNQLLFQVNNRDAFLQMMDDKMALQERIKALLPEQEVSAGGRWYEFYTSLGPASLVAELPSLLSADEQKLVASKGIETAYQLIRRQERGMADYFYIAPYDGVVYERSAKAGDQIRKNQVVARIGKRGKLIVKSTVVDFSVRIGRIEVMDQKHTFLTTGVFLKAVQDPLDKHSWDVYFSVDDSKSLQVGENVIVSIQLK